MKKTLVTLLLLVGLLALPLAAQVTFGIGPGAQYSSGRQHPLSLAYHREYRCTAFGEMYVNIPVGWTLSIRPGLMYATKEFNMTVVYSGRLHRTTPGTFQSGWLEESVLLISQPVPWFHFGGGGYVAESMSRTVSYKPITDIIYETTPQGNSKTVGIMCCPPPPPPPPKPKPKPIPNGDPVINQLKFDYGYILKVGIDWYIKCPTWTCKNSIDFTFSRGMAKVFSTYGRYYVNETLAASYTLWF